MQEPSTPTPPPQGALQQLKTNRKFQLVVGAGLVLILAFAGYYLLAMRPVIDPAIVSRANFSVYTPRSIPEGYRMNPDQTRLEGNILTYVLEDDEASQDITVTVQPKPSGFDMAKLTSGGTVNATSTKNGKLYDLSAGKISKHLLESGDSLVFITSSDKVENAVIVRLADTLVKQ